MAHVRMLQRRATASEWTLENPILGEGEIGHIKGENSFKFGDGVTHWVDLPLFAGGGGGFGAFPFSLNYFVIRGRFTPTSSAEGGVSMGMEWARVVVEDGLELTYPDSPSWCDIEEVGSSYPWSFKPGAYLFTMVATSNHQNLGPIDVYYGCLGNPPDGPFEPAYTTSLTPGYNNDSGTITFMQIFTEDYDEFGASVGFAWRSNVLDVETANVDVEVTVFRLGDATLANVAGVVGGGGTTKEIIRLTRSGTLIVSNGIAAAYFEYDGHISLARIAAGIVPTGASINTRLNINDSPAHTMSIAAGTKTTVETGLTIPVYAGDYATLDVTQVGSIDAGAYLTMNLEVTPT